MKKISQALLASALAFSPQIVHAKEPVPQDPTKMETVVRQIYEATQGTILEDCNFVFSAGRIAPLGTENARTIDLGFSTTGCQNPKAYGDKNYERADAIRLKISKEVIKPVVLKLDEALGGQCFQIDNWKDLNVARISLISCNEDQAIS